MDSNHDKSLQRALCYHYTIGQTAGKIAFRECERKGKFVAEGQEKIVITGTRRGTFWGMAA
jgi:hypothetical protein